MCDEKRDESRRQLKEVKQHDTPSPTNSIQLEPTSKSADLKSYSIKPGKNAFARRRIREQDEAYAAALQAAFDPLSEERYRLASNAFYQQQQQRKGSGSEESPSLSSFSSSSPTVASASNEPQIERNQEMTKKSIKAIEVNHSRRYSGNLEMLKHEIRGAEVPERPITAMSHFIRGDATKDEGERTEMKINGIVRNEVENLKLVPEGIESEDHGKATFRSRVEGKSEKRMLKIMRGSPLTPVFNDNDTGREAYGSSPTKSGATATIRASKDIDKSTNISSGGIPKIPHKKIFGLNISIPNFRPNTSANAATSAVVPSTSNRLVPPKAAQLLGTEEAPGKTSANNRNGKIRIHPYHRMKRIETSASLPAVGGSHIPKHFRERHSRSPILRNRKRLNMSEGSYDFDKSSILDLSEDEGDYTYGENIHDKDIGKRPEVKLERHDSLQYYNGTSPPTPPEKNTPPKGDQIDTIVEAPKEQDRVMKSTKIKRKQVSRHQVLDVVTAEKVPAIIGDGRSSPTRDGRYGHSGRVGLVESPRVVSVRASFVNATVVEEQDGASNGNRFNFEEVKNDKRVESEGYQDTELENSDLGQANQLLPTFYSPSIYSMAFDAPQFRPSHNQDPSRYYISSSSSNLGVTTEEVHKDFSSEQMQDLEHKNASSAESTPIRVEEHKDNTFTFEIGESENSMMRESDLTDDVEVSTKSGLVRDDISSPPMDFTVPAKDLQPDTSSTMGNFTGFCLSAMPTPLMGHSPIDMMSRPPPVPPLPSVLPTGNLSVSDRPDPQSIITHFDIVHHHMERSAMTIHQSVAASMELMMEKITKKIDESTHLAKASENEHIRMLKNVTQEAAELRKLIECIAVKLDEIEKTNMKVLSDKVQTVVHVNTKMYKTVEAMAARIGELEKKLESTQDSQQKQQLQVQRELRQLQHIQRSDTPFENYNFNNTGNYNSSVQTAPQQSPTHLPLGTAASASGATVTPASFTAQSMPSVPATMSWPSYNYNYGYNYSSPPHFSMSRQHFQQMDPQSRRAFVTDHALQLASPDISQHPAFAVNATSGDGSLSGFYEQEYGYGMR